MYEMYPSSFSSRPSTGQVPQKQTLFLFFDVFLSKTLPKIKESGLINHDMPTATDAEARRVRTC